MNYKMTVTIANPKTPDGMCSDLTMNLKCSFSMEENRMCDEYRDFFDTFEEAAAWADQARRA